MRPLLSLIAVIAIILVFPSCRDTTVSPLKHVRFDPELLNRVQIADTASLPGANTVGLKVDTRQVHVTFRNDLSYADQQQLLNKYGFVQSISLAQTPNSATVQTLELVDGLDQLQLKKALHLLSEDPGIVSAGPSLVAE